MKKTKQPTSGKWGLGNIALFGAILMSKGIVGKEKEALKELMYHALKTTAPLSRGGRDNLISVKDRD